AASPPCVCIYASSSVKEQSVNGNKGLDVFSWSTRTIATALPCSHSVAVPPSSIIGAARRTAAVWVAQARRLHTAATPSRTVVVTDYPFHSDARVHCLGC